MLNHTSAFIWKRLAKPATAESIAGEISQSYDKVALVDALNDMRAVLGEVLQMGLAVAAGDSSG